MIRPKQLAFIALAAAAVGCSDTSKGGDPPEPAKLANLAAPTWDPADKEKALLTGKELIAKHECTRCHEVDGLPGIGRPYDCVSCHVFLKGLTPDDRRYKKIAANNGKDVLDRYIANIEHFLEIPSLSGIAKRVRPEWIAGFLRQPHDLRPILDESMIRNQLTDLEIKALVRYFAASADMPDPYAVTYRPPAPLPKPPPKLLEAGREKFATSGCPGCHVVGNIDFGVPPETLYAGRELSLLAPNLRFVRDRSRADSLVDWIFDPGKVKPGTKMPKMVPDRDTAELIAGWLMYGDLGELPAPPDAAALMKLPPVLDRKVSYEEVKEEVLGFVCVHCHMNDHEKDTGPGNNGGLGYSGIDLSFRTYERTVWGALGPDGKRYSVLETLPGEEMSRLLATMLRRKVENLRDHRGPFRDVELPGFGDGLLGMPVGLPALSDDKIALVRTWIEQGCVGPTKVTGKPGFTDGFLVPDGPIKVNKGCGLRAPADPPPKWSSKPKAEKDDRKGVGSGKVAGEKKPSKKPKAGDGNP